MVCAGSGSQIRLIIMGYKLYRKRSVVDFAVLSSNEVDLYFVTLLK